MRRITWTILGDASGQLLDVGCGPHWELAQLPPGVWGIGLDRRRLPRVQAPTRAHPFVHADAGMLPFRTGAFDLVLALDLLEQQGLSPEIVMGEIHRVLRSGGRLLVRVPAHPWLYGPHDRDWGGARRYRKAELKALVQGAGFGICRLTYTNSFIFPFAALVSLGERAGLLKDDLLWLQRPFGGFLLRVLDSEAHWLRKHHLPMGLSLVCLAEA
jgi:SAM-dependent methyltransferase